MLFRSGRFQVDRYMEYNGRGFPKRFDPLSYLYIVKMMNIFDCTRHYDDLAHALLPICAKVTLVAFSDDMLFPPSCMREMHETLQGIGKACDYHHHHAEPLRARMAGEWDRTDLTGAVLQERIDPWDLPVPASSTAKIGRASCRERV